MLKIGYFSKKIWEELNFCFEDYFNPFNQIFQNYFGHEFKLIQHFNFK